MFQHNQGELVEAVDAQLGHDGAFANQAIALLPVNVGFGFNPGRGELYNSSLVSRRKLIDVAMDGSSLGDLYLANKPVRTLDDIAKSCNWILYRSEHYLEIKAKDTGIAITRVAEDSFGSGKMLATVAAAAAIKEKRAVDFVVDVNLSDRERMINHAAPFGGVDDGDSYSYYLSLIHSDDGGAPTFGYETFEFRDSLTGALSIAGLLEAIDNNGAQDSVVLYDVEERDLISLRGLPYTAYFQTEREYQADAIMSAASYVHLAIRRPHGVRDNNNRWLAVGENEIISEYYPLCPGPEHKMYLYYAVEDIANAEFRGVFSVPSTIDECQTHYRRELDCRLEMGDPPPVLPGKYNGWLDVLPELHRPRIIHYESIDSVYWAEENERTLEVYQEWPGKPAVFGGALRKGKIHHGYLQRMRTLKCMTSGDVDMFHAAIAVFAGIIPRGDDPVVNSPVWAAVYVMCLDVSHGFSSRRFDIESIRRG